MEEKAHLIAQGSNLLDVLSSMSHNVVFIIGFINSFIQGNNLGSIFVLTLTCSPNPSFLEKKTFSMINSGVGLFTLLLILIGTVYFCCAKAIVLHVQERKRKKEEAASAKLLENEKRNKVREKENKHFHFSAFFLWL